MAMAAYTSVSRRGRKWSTLFLRCHARVRRGATRLPTGARVLRARWPPGRSVRVLRVSNDKGDWYGTTPSARRPRWRCGRRATSARPHGEILPQIRAAAHEAVVEVGLPSWPFANSFLVTQFKEFDCP